jgi:hypothetical protein
VQAAAPTYTRMDMTTITTLDRAFDRLREAR